jgi:thioredoxin reductase (NADPH)
MEESLYLAGLCKSVTVVHRRNELRASKIMVKRAKEHPKISFVWDSVVSDVKDPEEGAVSAVVLTNVKTGARSSLPVQGLFVAIGHSPNTELFRGQLALTDNGYVQTGPGSTETSVEGVFAAGDVQDHVYRQAVTAAGTGCMAAIQAERWLGAQGLA